MYWWPPWFQWWKHTGRKRLCRNQTAEPSECCRDLFFVSLGYVLKEVLLHWGIIGKLCNFGNDTTGISNLRNWAGFNNTKVQLMTLTMSVEGHWGHWTYLSLYTCDAGWHIWCFIISLLSSLTSDSTSEQCLLPPGRTEGWHESDWKTLPPQHYVLHMHTLVMIVDELSYNFQQYLWSSSTSCLWKFGH